MGELVRGGRRFESGDRTLEEQRGALGILDGEAHEGLHERLHRGPRIGRQVQRVEPRAQLTVAVGEHRVVKRVLRVEVHVERRLAYADLARQCVEREGTDAVRAGEPPRRGDDRRRPLLPSLDHLPYHR